MLQPRNTWKDKEAYDAAHKKLAALFQKNFHQYEAGASEAVLASFGQVMTAAVERQMAKELG